MSLALINSFCSILKVRKLLNIAHVAGEKKQREVLLTSRPVRCAISAGTFLTELLLQSRSLAEDPQTHTSSGMAYLN